LIFREAAGFNVGELSKSVDHFIPALDKHFVGIVSQLGASFRRERTLKSAPVFFLSALYRPSAKRMWRCKL
jgi:hypothetical protein